MNKTIKYGELLEIICDELTEKHGKKFDVRSVDESSAFYNSKVQKYDSKSFLRHYIICSEDVFQKYNAKTEFMELLDAEEKVTDILKLIQSYDKAIGDFRDDESKRIRLSAMRDMALETLTGDIVHCYTERHSFGMTDGSRDLDETINVNDIKDNFEYISQSLITRIKSRIAKEDSMSIRLTNDHTQNQI